MAPRQQPVRQELDWLVSGRSQDGDLEGHEVHVNRPRGPQRGSHKLTGHVVGRGTSLSFCCDGSIYTPADFVKLAGWADPKEPLKHIYVSRCGLTADKVLEGKGSSTPYGKWCLDQLFKHLKEDYNVVWAGDLPRFCKVRALQSKSVVHQVVTYPQPAAYMPSDPLGLGLQERATASGKSPLGRFAYRVCR